MSSIQYMLLQNNNSRTNIPDNISKSESNSNNLNNTNNYQNLMMDSLLLRSSSESFSIDRNNLRNLSMINESHRERVLSFNSSHPNSQSQIRKNPKSFLNQMKCIAKKGSLTEPYKDNKMSAFSERLKEISTAPIRMLDAPSLIDDYYLNLIDWSSKNMLAVALDNSVYLWNGNTSETLQLMTADDLICSVNWIEGGHCLAVGMKNGHIELWDTNKLQQIRDMPGHNDRVCSLSWNQFLLSSGSKDTRILNHDVRLRNHAVHTLVGHSQEVCSLKWAPDGGLLASGGNDNTICIWDINCSGGVSSNVGGVSSQGGHSNFNNSQNANLGNLPNNININNASLYQANINNGQNSMRATFGPTAYMFNMVNNINPNLENQEINNLNNFNNFNHINTNIGNFAIPSSIQTNLNNNVSNSTLIRSNSQMNAQNNFNNNSQSGRRITLNSNSSNNIQNNFVNNLNSNSITNSIWNIINEDGEDYFSNSNNNERGQNQDPNQIRNSGRNGVHHASEIFPKFTFTQHEAAVKALAWCPWQKGLLASGAGSKDKTIKFWNCDTGYIINSVNTGSQVCALLWSKQEKELISSHGYSKNQISIWRYPSMYKVTELHGHMSRVLYLAMSPDGSTIVSGAGDETLRFWKIHENNKTSSDSLGCRGLNEYQLR